MASQTAGPKKNAEGKNVGGATPSQEVRFATISGRITRHIGGPLGGAAIECGEVKSSSDRNGEYTLKIPETKGKVTVKFSSIGFLAETREVEVAPDARATLDLVMGMGKTSLEGRISDRVTGLALPGVYVSIETARTHTDEDGRYAFRDVSALTKYTLTVYKEGYETKYVVTDKAENGKTLTCDVQLDKRVPEQPSP